MLDPDKPLVVGRSHAQPSADVMVMLYCDGCGTSVYLHEPLVEMVVAGTHQCACQDCAVNFVGWDNVPWIIKMHRTCACPN